MYLQKIDMQSGGVFQNTFKHELKSITKELSTMFPKNESVQRLIKQYAALLANWR